MRGSSSGTAAVEEARTPRIPSAHRRLLVVAYCFPPHGAVGILRTLRLVKQLAAQGWSTTVLTGAPESYAPGTPQDVEMLREVPPGTTVLRTHAFRGLSRLSSLVRSVGGQRWRRRPLRQAASSGGVPRAGRPGIRKMVEQLFAIPDGDAGWFVPAVTRGLATGWRERPDAIYSSAPPWTGHLVAQVLAAVFRCPWIADFRDPWARGPWRDDRSWLVKRATEFFEARAVRRATAVLFTTYATRDEVVSHYGPWLAAKCHVVRNGCDLAEFSSVVPEPTNGDFTLAHVGSIYGARNPTPLFRAIASMLQNGCVDGRHFRLRLIGPVGLRGVNLQAACKALGLEDVVEFVPQLSRRESLAAMQSASALLLIQPGHPLSVPAKTFEYLAAAKPILALTDEGETADLIKASGVGLVVPPEDETRIRTALASLLRGASDRRSGPPRVLYDGQMRAAEMVAILESLTWRGSDRQRGRTRAPYGAQV